MVWISCHWRVSGRQNHVPKCLQRDFWRSNTDYGHAARNRDSSKGGAGGNFSHALCRKCQFSCCTGERNQLEFMSVKQEQCSVTAYCASVQLHSRPANIYSEPPRSVSIILQETSVCHESLYISTTSLVTSRRLANRIKPSPFTVPTCRNMRYRRQKKKLLNPYKGTVTQTIRQDCKAWILWTVKFMECMLQK